MPFYRLKPTINKGVKMFDIDITNIKPTSNNFHEMSIDEQLKFLEDEYEIKREVLDMSDEIDKIYIGYINQQAIIQTRNEIPKDPLWIHYSMEAWTINETIKKILNKFKLFFPKIFAYIGTFVIIRTKSSKLQCEKWLNILVDKTKNQERIDKIFNDSDAKSAKVEFVTNALNSAADAYSKFSDQANSVKGFKSVGKSDTDKEKLQSLFTVPPEYQKFLDNKKLVDDATPSENSSVDTSVTYKDGGWDDPSKIDKLVKALDHVSSVLENIKRLRSICDEMVNDLGKEQKGEAAETGIVKELNNEKIKFLKELSNKVLSGMMESIGRFGSLSAKNCRTFCNQYGQED